MGEKKTIVCEGCRTTVDGSKAGCHNCGSMLEPLGDSYTAISPMKGEDSGHMTAHDKKAVLAMLNQGVMHAKVGKKEYKIKKEKKGYSVEMYVRDRGMIPVPGSPLRASVYKARFEAEGTPVEPTGVKLGLKVARSGTLKGLEGLINEYYFSKSYKIHPDLGVSNSKGPFKGIVVVKKGKAYEAYHPAQ